MLNDPIIIGGCDRSGTSLLRACCTDIRGSTDASIAARFEA